MKAALYARVSTKDKGQNPENQLLPMRQLAKERGWTITNEYVEHESASGRVRRRQYEAMMREATSDQYNVLVFWSLDRFSREGVAQTLLDLQRLTKAGVMWVSLQDPIPDEPGPIRDLVISIMASLAQLETNRRSERAKAAIRRIKAKGGSWGRQRVSVDLDELARLYRQDYSISALAKHFGASRGTITARLKDIEDSTNNVSGIEKAKEGTDHNAL